MKTLTLHNLSEEKAKWPAGPWMDEPDTISFYDATTNLPCMILRQASGHLCGYVGVVSAHPLYKKCYSDLYEDELADFSVHGGLTFAGQLSSGILELDEQANLWFFGFDCNHCDDYAPSYTSIFSKGPEQYRNLSYVIAETTGLAYQLADYKLPQGAQPMPDTNKEFDRNQLLNTAIAATLANWQNLRNMLAPGGAMTYTGQAQEIGSFAALVVETSIRKLES